MSLEIYTPDEWPEDEPGTQLGTASNGVLRWAPTWYPGGWDDEEKQERFVAWCVAHPGAVIPTDQGDLSGASFAQRYGEESSPSLTLADLDARLRLYGWR